jgi:hypothetical protein
MSVFIIIIFNIGEYNVSSIINISEKGIDLMMHKFCTVENIIPNFWTTNNTQQHTSN